MGHFFPASNGTKVVLRCDFTSSQWHVEVWEAKDIYAITKSIVYVSKHKDRAIMLLYHYSNVLSLFSIPTESLENFKIFSLL